MKLSRKGPAIARIVLGLVFLVFGLNGFLQFLPQPASIPERAAAVGAARAAPRRKLPPATCSL
jgi:uncharacterized membrane protein YphA (DoxX/SURF4 family)